MHRWGSEFRYAVRRLRQTPGFSLTAILTLCIAIGGATAVFSVVEPALLRPLPFSESSKLVSLHEHLESDNHELRMTAPDIGTFEREARAFSGVAGYTSAGYELTGAGTPFQARAERVTASLFPTLKVQPVLGRAFSRQEDESSTPVTIISHALWIERFHADPSILGRTVNLDRRPYTIIGVMPRGFDFPFDGGMLAHRDLWVPMSFNPVEKESEGDNFDYSAVARVKPDLTLKQAQLDVDRIMAGIQAQYPAKSGLLVRGYFVPLHDEVTASAKPILRVLTGAIGLVLLIACVNLANLLSVRAAGRQHEFSLRSALGASRSVLVRQITAESLLLSFVGGCTGITLAAALIRIAVRVLPDSIAPISEIGISWPVLMLALVLIAVTGLACGLVPALEGTRLDLLSTLRQSAVVAGSARRSRLRSGMVVVEIGMSLVLLIASGLVLRSFQKVLAVDLGFDASHLLTASLSLPLESYSTQDSVDAFLNRMNTKLLAEPGVKAVGFGSNIPVVGQKSGRLIAPEGYVKPNGEGMIIASNYLVHGDYFNATRIPLLRGRFFRASDDLPGAPLVAVISQKLANQYFKGRDPIGLHIKVGPSFATSMPPMAIVGVVGDVKQGAQEEATVPQMYEPLTQGKADLGPYGAMMGVAGSMTVLVRGTGEPTLMSEAVSRAARELDPLLPVTHMASMNAVVAASEGARRFGTVALTSFAALALMLSLLGVYGVIAFAVTERAREFAIRMALGSSRERVLSGVLRSALVLTTFGAIVGLAISAAMTRVVSSLLFQVKPLDATVILCAVATLFLCSLSAAWLPAQRASMSDPIDALRGH